MSNNLQDSPLKFIKRNLNINRVTSLLKRGVNSFYSQGLEATMRKVDFRIKLMTKGDVWRFRSDIPLKKELAQQRKTTFDYMPKISIVVPLYNTPKNFLKEMIDSVVKQSYANWQLVLVDASTSDFSYIHDVVKSYNDKRITYKKLDENLGISENTNKGFDLAQGDYIALLDHDDVILPNALFENVKAINTTNYGLRTAEPVKIRDGTTNIDLKDEFNVIVIDSTDPQHEFSVTAKKPTGEYPPRKEYSLQGNYNSLQRAASAYCSSPSVFGT